MATIDGDLFGAMSLSSLGFPSDFDYPSSLLQLRRATLVGCVAYKLSSQSFHLGLMVRNVVQNAPIISSLASRLLTPSQLLMRRKDRLSEGGQAHQTGAQALKSVQRDRSRGHELLNMTGGANAWDTLLQPRDQSSLMLGHPLAAEDAGGEGNAPGKVLDCTKTNFAASV